MTLQIARTVSGVREIVAATRAKNETVALVPTMGGLHAGHLALVKHAGKLCDHVMVSMFVNPTQFNRREDFENYPGDEKADLAILNETCANSVFIPSASEMYPEGFNTRILVSGADKILCDAHRPGHFEGVATVVAKLFLQTGADIACFGEKDFQQLYIVKQMVADLNIPIRVEPVPTVREVDGLALSSRNARLTQNERNLASRLHETMQWVAKKIQDGETPNIAIAEGRKKLDEEKVFDVEYLELRSSNTLEALETYKVGIEARLFIAANLGKVRLIDNIAV